MQIGPEGAMAMADALKVNPVLSSLDMSNTRIGEYTYTDAVCQQLYIERDLGRVDLCSDLTSVTADRI
jgi:hypothetical protein